VTVKVNETTVINAVASSGAKVTYVSGNSAIATVDEDGTVTGVAEGETTITVSVPAYNGYPTAVETCKVTVTAAEQGGEDNESSIVYTFATAKSTTNTAYANVYDVTIDRIQWSVPGNQNFSGYVRIGGKNLSNVVRTIYSKGSVTGNITKIVMSTNGVSNANLKVNSITLKVFATAADAASATSTPISTITNTDTDWKKSTSKVITFEKPVSDSWSDCYYRIEFNVTNSNTSSNYGIDLQKMEFYN
jgi:hypothetical protein